MSQLQRVALVFLCMFSFACRKQNSPSKINKILILGNSITLHAPEIKLGWYGNWGMAATRMDKDYVHVLEKLMDVSITPVNLSAWENDPKIFDFSSIQSYLATHPDLILIRLGENVSNSNTLEQDLNVLKTQIRIVEPTTKIAVTGTFWTNPKVDDVLKKFAKDNSFLFIPLSQLDRNEFISSLGAQTTGVDGEIYPITNYAVAAHPGDEGMKKIAEAIANTLKIR